MGITFSSTNRVITTRSQLEKELSLLRTNETPQTLSTDPIDQQHDQLISSFLEVAVGQTVETAQRFLETTNWNIEESINLFLLDPNYDPSMYNDDHVASQSHHETAQRFSETTSWNIEEPINRFLLNNNYDPSMYSDDHVAAQSYDENFDDGGSDSTLSSMYRPPVDLLFTGRTFEEAKSTSCEQNLWLLVNLQSRTEFACHTLNRDLWANDTVSETVMSSFVLWQVYDNTIEGKKISSFYKIEATPPVVLVIDPVTGQRMRMWSGVIEAQSFVEDLSRFLEAGPREHIASLIRNRRPETEEEEDIGWSCNNTDQVPAPSWGEEIEKEETWSASNNVEAPSWGEEFEKGETWCSSNNNAPSRGPGFEVKEEENGLYLPDMNMIEEPKGECEFQDSDQVKEEEETCLEYPDLTEEPKGDCDRSLVCSLCVRFPDGRRKQRRFLKSEPVQLLWSFCYSHMEGFERRAFNLVQAIPGALKTIDYGANATFEQSGLDNSMVSVAWE